MEGERDFVSTAHTEVARKIPGTEVLAWENHRSMVRVSEGASKHGCLLNNANQWFSFSLA